MYNVSASQSIYQSHKPINLIYNEANLANADINEEYIVKEVKTNDEEIKNFLLTLGCYKGEKVTVLSVLSENYIVSIKDARYSIDKELAELIIVFLPKTDNKNNLK